MKKQNHVLVICLISVIFALGCSQAAQFQVTATPHPTAMPIAGWQRFEGNGIEIWLPQSYQGGDLSKNIKPILSQLKALGPEFESYAHLIEQNPSTYSLWAYDANINGSKFLTNMAITNDQGAPFMDLDQYMKESLKQLPDMFEVKDQQNISLNGYDARKIMVEATISGIAVKETMYILKEKRTFWLIIYATSLDEYEVRAPIFEQSAGTVLIRP